MNNLGTIFQNYIWVPIVSAVVGAVLAWAVPVVIKKVKNIVNKNVDEISIAGEWNSFFNEEKKLQTEKVHLEQVGREITGTMKMNGRTYFFNGQFKNQILLGQYESKNSRKDERGTIVLRYINDKILSGYCTFIYKNKQVYNSSYVLTLESSHKVDKGTYQFCNACVGKFDCCCNCEDIDMPILLPFETETISRKTKENVDKFAEKKSSNLYQMKRKSEHERECFFSKTTNVLYMIIDRLIVGCFHLILRKLTGNIGWFITIKYVKLFQLMKRKLVCVFIICVQY